MGIGTIRDAAGVGTRSYKNRFRSELLFHRHDTVIPFLALLKSSADRDGQRIAAPKLDLASYLKSRLMSSCRAEKRPRLRHRLREPHALELHALRERTLEP